MTDITSIISENQTITSVLSTSSVKTLSSLADVDLQNVNNGSVLIYNNNEFIAQNISGAFTIDESGVATITPNLITKDTLGLSNVDNTSDINKPLSIATQTALATKVDAVSGKGLSDENYTFAEKTKLAGIAVNSTKNFSDEYLLNRAHHSGTQSYTTITGLGTLATQSGTFSGSSSGINTGDQTFTLGGDASGSGSSLINVTLAPTGVIANTYNNSTAGVSPFTIDAKGRIIAVGNTVTITPHWDNIISKPNTVSSYGITDAVDLTSSQIITGSKDFHISPTVPLIPTSAGHAASKAYVDTLSEGLHVHASAHVIITDSLENITGGTVLYDNGIDGIGAKLTCSIPIDVDGGDLDGDTHITTGSRLIIAGQSNTAYNGIYVFTSSTILTRAEDFDTPLAMGGGDFIFVTHGNTHADTGWVLGEAVTTVGISPVIFVQFSGAGTYEAGDGLQRTDLTFSVKGTSGRIAVSSSGVDLSTYGTAGTYKSVTVDEYGRVSGGTNPTTLSGYGITDAATSSELNSHITDSTIHITSTQNILLDGITVTAEKINYLAEVTSNIQGQLDNKSATTHTHSNATVSSHGFMSSSDKIKLDEIESGAEVNVNADWSATSGDAAILNKPTTLSGYGITDSYSKTEANGIFISDAPSDNKQYARKNANWAEVVSGSFMEAIPTSASFLAEAGKHYSINATSGIVATLPNFPIPGNIIHFSDAKSNWSSVPLTINPNGLKINSSTSAYTANVSGDSIAFIYIDNIIGWATYKAIGPTGPEPSINVINNSNTLITLSDLYNNRIINCTSSSAITINIPLALSSGFSCMIIQGNIGKITLQGESGVILNSFGGLLSSAGQHAPISIIQLSNAIYNISGNLV